jgi:hypothetical protein
VFGRTCWGDAEGAQVHGVAVGKARHADSCDHAATTTTTAAAATGNVHGARDVEHPHTALSDDLSAALTPRAYR